MTNNLPIKENQSVVAALDQVIFIKKGYSFWKHLIPFSVAALLLIVLSLPADNLLSELTNKLATPGWIWIPAALLTVVACTAYASFLYVQVRNAYLWTDGGLRRSLVTAALYLFLCASMAYGVLHEAISQSMTWNVVWACVLLAALSLTGVGWSQADSWVEAIGIKMPDYTEARVHAKRLADLVMKVRGKAYGETEDIEEFLKAADDLRGEIDKNKNLEPPWARPDVELASNDVGGLIKQTKRYFPLDKDTAGNKQAIERFSSACKSEMPEKYREFVTALQIMSGYWLDWKIAKRRSR